MAWAAEIELTTSKVNPVELKETSDIVDDLLSFEWINNPEKQIELVKDISTKLMSFDLGCDNGTQFKEAHDFLEELYKPFEECYPKFIRIKRIPYGESGRDAIIVLPFKDGALFNDVETAFRENCNDFYANYPNTVYHFHTDIFQRTTPENVLVSSDNKILFGAGSNDMLIAAAMTVLLLAQCYYFNIPPPLIIGTQDEERKGNLGSDRLLQKFQSSLLTIDLEPIAGFGGAYCDVIAKNTGIRLPYFPNFTEEVQRLIQYELNTFFSNTYSTFVSHDGNHVYLNVDNSGYTMDNDELVRRLWGMTLKHWDISEEIKPFETGDEKKESIIDSPQRKIIESVLRKHTKFMPTKRHPRHFSFAQSNMLGQFNRRTTMYGGFNTQTFNAYENNLHNVIILGVNELRPRHTEFEAALLSQGKDLLNTSFEIHKNLVNLGRIAREN